MLEDLGKMVQDIIVHELDIITDSEWFDDLIQEKVDEAMGDPEYQYEVGMLSELNETQTVRTYRGYQSALRWAQRLTAMSDSELTNIPHNLDGRIIQVFIDRWTVDGNGVTEPDKEFTAVVFQRKVNDGRNS